MKTVILKTYDELDYVLAYLPDNSCTPFVCGYAPRYTQDDNGKLMIDYWGQGHYFGDIENAMDYMRRLKKERGIR